MEITQHLGTACLFLDLIHGNCTGLGVSYKLGFLGSTGWILIIALICCPESAAFPRSANVCCLSGRLEVLF